MKKYQCKICMHPKRVEIERELVQGANITNTADKYSVTYNSLYNHFHNHVSRQLSQVYERREMQHGDDMLTKISEIVTKAETIFTRNFESGRDLTALKALSEQRNTWQLLAQIIAHAEKLRQDSLEGSREEEERRNRELVQRRLSILTTEELLFLHRIEKKLESGSRDEIIIPDKKPVFSDNIPPLRRTRTPIHKPTPPEPSEATESEENTGDNPYVVQIPFTPWSKNPLNPRCSE